ncbi:MAG: RNA-binding protein [Verrucomicrobia bacterium]|nr:RNA-binding protein [Verrucomicrobiota bacterium]MCH8528260.1 RNA-binding protein [Kiritimatiellia bacterium]
MSVRLDKWLWAARFFKTRTLAQAAIEGGKVHLNGSRTKPGHSIQEGVMLEIRAGMEVYEVEVLALADKRGPASVARGLYRETEESKVRRERDSLARKAAAMATPTREGKPDRYQRRRIQKLLNTKSW